MKFTFDEWKKIQHALTCARDNFEKFMNESKPNDDYLSSYQIFKRQMIEVDNILNKIKTFEI